MRVMDDRIINTLTILTGLLERLRKRSMTADDVVEQMKIRHEVADCIEEIRERVNESTRSFN